MSTVAERLTEARSSRFASASQAAIALGIPVPTYAQYENGTRAFSRHAERFANFFRVNVEWLLTGRGPMRGGRGRVSIPLRGVVGAGGVVSTHFADEINGMAETIDLPDIESLGALLVKGDSQRPRFFDGEFVVYRTIPKSPPELVGEFAVVDTADGRTMIKLLRFGRIEGTFHLESINADPEENVYVDCAYEHVLTIPTKRRFSIRSGR